jgi:hypothetical protein
VKLGPGEGRVFLVTPVAITSVKVDVPDSARGGEPAKIAIAIAGESGAAIPAVLPLHVEITDPAGRNAESTGHHAAKNGRLELTLDIAANDTPGVWQIRVRELASGREAVRHFRVVRP